MSRLNGNDFSGWHFQKLDHNFILGHEAFRLLSVLDHGIYFNLRLQAGRTRQLTGATDGSISLGADRKASRAAVAKWFGAMPGLSAASALAALDRLAQAGLIVVRRKSQVVCVARWLEEQGSPPSDEAARKRKSRENQAQLIFMDVLSDRRGQYVLRSELLDILKKRISGGKKLALDFIARSVAQGLLRSVEGDPDTLAVEMVGCSENAGNRDSAPSGRDSVPPAPPSISSFEKVTIHRPESVTSHQMNRKIEEDMNISSKGRNPSIRGFPTGGAGGTEGANPPPLPVSREDIFGMSPLECCEILVGARGRYDQNCFAKQLRELKARFGEHEGTGKFRACMESLWCDLRDPSPKNPIRNRAAVLNSKINALFGVVPEKK